MHHPRVCIGQYPSIELELLEMITREVGRALGQMRHRTVHKAPVLTHALPRSTFLTSFA